MTNIIKFPTKEPEPKLGITKQLERQFGVYNFREDWQKQSSKKKRDRLNSWVPLWHIAIGMMIAVRYRDDKEVHQQLIVAMRKAVRQDGILLCEIPDISKGYVAPSDSGMFRYIKMIFDTEGY